MSMSGDMKLVPGGRMIVVTRQNVDLTGVLSCRATLFEYLRHNHVNLRQVPMM